MEKLMYLAWLDEAEQPRRGGRASCLGRVASELLALEPRPA